MSFAILLAIRWTAGLHPSPDQHPPDWQIVVPAVAAVSLFIAFVLPVVMLWIGTAIVVISDLGINHNVMWGRGWRHNFWSWNEIQSVSITQDNRADESYRVLKIHLRDGDIHWFAISKAVTDDQIASSIKDTGHSTTIADD